MDECQFKILFDIVISHIKNHNLSDEKRTEIRDSLFDSIERSVWELPSTVQIHQDIAPVMFKLMIFTQYLEDFRDDKLKHRH